MAEIAGFLPFWQLPPYWGRDVIFPNHLIFQAFQYISSFSQTTQLLQSSKYTFLYMGSFTVMSCPLYSSRYDEGEEDTTVTIVPLAKARTLTILPSKTLPSLRVAVMFCPIFTTPYSVALLMVSFPFGLLIISTLYRSYLSVQVRIVLGKRFFVTANIMPKIFYAVWHNICSACHFGRKAAVSAILAVELPS